MPAETAMITPRLATVRSRKTNGRRAFVEGDGRSPWARRWRDLKELYADDLGGASTLSEFQLGLIATAASLRCEIEKLEGRLSVGDESIDLDQLGRLVGHFRRIVETLGVERRRRDLVPDLHTYLANKAAQQTTEDAPV